MPAGSEGAGAKVAEHAAVAFGVSRFARGAAMPDEIEMESVDRVSVRTHDVIEDGMGILGTDVGGDQSQPAANSMHVRIDRHGR